MLIDIVARLLRCKLIPHSLSYKLWLLFLKRRGGAQFHFHTQVFGKPMIYGGVAGSTDNAIFTDLDRYEPELNGVLQQCLSKVPCAANVVEWSRRTKSDLDRQQVAEAASTCARTCRLK